MRKALSCFILVGAAIAAAGARQQASVCEMFSPADITGVIGPGASPGRPIVSGSCVWTAKGISLTVARVDTGDPAAALAMVGAVKGRGQKGDDVHDEPGLGQGAVSTFNGNKRGLSLIAADGGTSWHLAVDSGDQLIDARTMLPKLRALVRKGISGAK
jgi:hypothetical protein